ncbi:MAG: 3-isopropylmalate dehydratase small subunit [Treponema sp.]|jgi:3-isopropylmalate/(R)-2-methylmalate dehydratase small subunit|nr:3-isopropylmalate dehydratase small subunit [Treponema sp.]
MKHFGGRVLFLDRDNINTDEIIPARYLTENTRESLKPHILEDLRLAGFDPARDCADRGAIVTRGNFGCGSSREHAPWVLEQNGINIVVASGFARIFRQNMLNCGMIPCELPPETIDGLFAEFAGVSPGAENAAVPAGAAVELSVTIRGGPASLVFTSGAREKIIPFALGDFENALIEAGGWVDYAAANY